MGLTFGKFCGIIIRTTNQGISVGVFLLLIDACVAETPETTSQQRKARSAPHSRTFLATELPPSSGSISASMQGQPMPYHSNIGAETNNLGFRNTEADKQASGITVFTAHTLRSARDWALE